MENLSLIKWHAQELHRLIELGPGNEILGDISNAIDAMILHGTMFQNIEANPPVIENESQA